MTTLVAFAELVLGFVPMIVIVLAIATALWAATKLLPSFGAWFDEFFERIMGTDAEYDQKHNTGYSSTTHYDQYV